jgi:hypothetical protein
LKSFPTGTKISSSPPSPRALFTPKEWDRFKRGFRYGVTIYFITLFGGAGLTGFLEGVNLETTGIEWLNALYSAAVIAVPPSIVASLTRNK